MCGIAGFIGEDQGKIAKMTQCLVHRGPDGNALWTGEGASLGHARLAILDPSPLGNQPMWNESKTVVIVYNGEIFNYRRLRDAEGLRCKTGSDTEVILKLYEKYGMDFIPRLLGMFALAIYDTRTQTLHIARDCSGIKPLYLTYVGGKPHFASEMRTLLSVLPAKPPIDETSLSLFMTLQYVPGPRTLCEGIESLPAGTILTWKDGRETRRRFTAERPVVPAMSTAAFKKGLPTVMQEVVEDHMIADRPVGMFLSGGMDSSIVLHHMAKARTSAVKTFTVRFEATEEEDGARFNRDADLAQLTAKHYKTDHQELLLTAADYRDLYRDTTRALDLPNADSVAVAQYALSKMAKKKADVVLTGAGGDELFGGYPRYRIARILKVLSWMPSEARAILGGFGGYPQDVLRMRPGPALALRLLGRPEAEITDVTKGAWFQSSAARTLFKSRFAEETSGDPIRQFMEFDRHLWLVDESLRLCDAVTMGSGLECRVPLLDPRVIAWSHAMPASKHVGLRRTKALLKDAYRGILPDHLYTLSKSSFYPPLAKWLRRECAPLVEEALKGKQINEYFDTAKLRTIFEEHRTKKKYGLHRLSNIVQLHHWFETVYDS
jgi:asparagine synthase (glutamine-hydrolysing)